MWRSFGFRDHWLAMQAGLLTALLVPLLWTGGMRCCQRFLTVLRKPDRCNSCMSAAQVRRVADVIRFGCRRYSLLPAACLARSLALHHLLGQRGIDTALCIGTRLEQGVFTAHAWVEFQGLPLAEAQPPRELFAAF